MAATAVPLGSRRRPHGRSLRPVGDERLVARVRAGDDAAFEAIYGRYYRGLLAFCRHMLGSRDEAIVAHAAHRPPSRPTTGPKRNRGGGHRRNYAPTRARCVKADVSIP